MIVHPSIITRISSLIEAEVMKCGLPVAPAFR